MEDLGEIRYALCELQLTVVKAILEERELGSADQLASVSEETAADTIYAIDRVAEHTILDWLDAFGMVTRFFPAGLTLLSQFEEALWKILYGLSDSPSPVIPTTWRQS